MQRARQPLRPKPTDGDAGGPAPFGFFSGSHRLVPMEREPRVFGLRGAAGAFPPNTIPAFEAALAEGADGLAFDVDVTADGLGVVCEDRLLRALTLGPRRVREATFADLREIDVGAGLASAHRGARVPRLDDVVQRFGSETPLLLIAALMDDRMQIERFVEAIEAALARAAGALREVAVAAEHPALLEALAGVGPGLTRLLRVPERCSMLLEIEAARDRIDGVCVPVRTPEAIVRRLDPSLRRVGTDCDTPAAAKRAASRQHDVLLSERPAWLRSRLRAVELGSA